MNQGRGIWITAALCVSFAGVAAAQDAGQTLRVSYGHHGAPSTPALRSSAALVLDATGSSVLYARHADVAMPIASITKLMTALVVIDAGQSLDEFLEVSVEDVARGRGTASRLTPGATLTRGDLMHLALMSSENRAAHALARSYPGGVEACVTAMNARARALGMTSAHFVEPTGLSDENVASAEDLSKLVMAAAKVPAIREYSTDSSYEVQVGRRMLTFRSTDSLTSKPDWDIVVQKTGYISEAGRCLVMQTIIEARTVVIVLLNSYGKRSRIADARRIRRWMESSEHPHVAPPVPGRQADPAATIPAAT
ncbi:MAG TPA: D-alanyl-D-alanine endopeptidase [Steroidobacteraceae bacterium]|jgi:D-alanyl-D-alanine endopeptidase (penicillin-binding protein 7)|nr:D-alanyl-D-alanine endopeptidase [Steroidobacteraceae bacterium]